MKKVLLRTLVVVGILGAVWGSYYLFQRLPERQQQTATASVVQGDLVIRSFTRGELRAVRSITLTAPNLFGTGQVTQLAPLGSFAQPKDLIVEFDETEVLSRLEERQLELDQTEEQLKQAQADLAIRNNQDQVDLLRSRYSVRQAELEVKRNELLSAIDARRNLLNLEESRRSLKQLESDVKSRLEQAEAELAVLQERKNRAELEMSRERQRLSQTKLLAPMSGLVTIMQSRSGFFIPGMQLPDIREGDEVRPGTPIAQILDLSEMEVVAKVGEVDRANLVEGQDVLIQLDALAGKRFSGKIKSMSGTASASVYAMDPAKKFDVVISLDMKELLSGLGASPEHINRIMNAAMANGGSPQAAPPKATLAARGGGGPGMQSPMTPPEGAATPRRGASEDAQGDAESASRRRPATQGAQQSDAERQKLREAMQTALGDRSLEDLSAEERRALMTKMRGSAEPSGTAAPSARAASARGGGAARGSTQTGSNGARATRQFSDEDLANAQLPRPPEAGDQLEVLVRPGLLADLEIIVERMSNVINIPTQAVFEKDGRPVVFVQEGNRFVERPVKLLKRSESRMVIEEGLQPGELVALSDPNAKPGEAQTLQQPAGAAPAGGAPGGMPMAPPGGGMGPGGGGPRGGF